MDKKVEQALQTASDFGTAGVVGGIITLIGTLTPGLQTLITLGIPALCCLYNLGNRINIDRIAQKDHEKVYKLIDELKSQMGNRRFEDLNNFIDLDFSTEEYAVIEGLVKGGINAKNIWMRRLIASILVTVGTVNTNELEGLQRCAKILEELDDLDIKLLILFICTTVNRNENGAEQDYNDIYSQLISDESVYAQSIKVSADKLKSLGLTMYSSSLHPYDDNACNKMKMVEDFLRQNNQETTAHLRIFIQFIKGTFNSDKQG